MDDTEIKRLYYVIMADRREDVRAEASRAFAESGDPELRTLAEIGNKIFQVLSGNAAPESLNGVAEEFGQFPVDEFWRTFSETSGQALLHKANTDKKNRKELIRLGLEMMVVSQQVGFRISDESARLVESLGREGGELAQSILDMRAMQTPGMGFSPPKKSSKESPKGRAPAKT